MGDHCVRFARDIQVAVDDGGVEDERPFRWVRVDLYAETNLPHFSWSDLTRRDPRAYSQGGRNKSALVIPHFVAEGFPAAAGVNG